MSNPPNNSYLRVMNDNIHVLYSNFRSNIGIVYGSSKSLIIDTGHNEDHVNALLKNINEKKPDYSVFTHYHMDHTLGQAYLECIPIAQINTLKNIEAYQTYDWSNEGILNLINEKILPPTMIEWFTREYPDRSKVKFKKPQILYQQHLKIDIGNQIVELNHIECDHTNDTTIVHVPNEEALFLGDCLSPSRENIINIPIFRKMIEFIFSYESKILVEGHGPPLGNKEGDKYLSDLMTLMDFIEQYKENSINKVEDITKRMEIFDKDSVSVYLPFFLNGLT